MSVAPIYYASDGSGNNQVQTAWGSSGVDLTRAARVAYGDGVSSMAGADRPDAREISNVLATQLVDPEPNSRNMSDMIYAWGQFIDHDLDLTPAGTTESDPITIPSDDATFTPGSSMPFTRDVYDTTTGTDASNPRQQPNTVTSYLDGSMIYGSDATRAAALRTFSGGQLKTSAGDLLPLNSDNLPEEVDIPGTDPTTLFLAGDVRVNENSELAAITTLFVREHNAQASKLAAAHPDWSDEKLYQGARQIVIAEIQAITYNEFLPALIGNTLPAYKGYSKRVNPGISTEFSTAAFRIGHSLVNGNIDFFANDGSESHDPIDFNASADQPVDLQGGPGFEGTGVDNIMKYLAADNSQEGDSQIEDALRNQLFAPSDPSVGGLDLYAIDIQRGRDMGLPDYNSERAAFGLPKVTSFDQISSDPAVQSELRQLYGTTVDAKGHTVDNVNDVDVFAGGLAEDHAAGSSAGPLFTRIIADQFERTRAGDRLWYQKTFSGKDLKSIQNTTLAEIIERNTSITNLQNDVFFFQTGTISGSVSKTTRLGQVTPAGSTQVSLLDASGALLATTRTVGGAYHFDNLDQATTYEVLVNAPLARAGTVLDQDVSLVDNSGAGQFDVDFVLK